MSGVHPSIAYWPPMPEPAVRVKRRVGDKDTWKELWTGKQVMGWMIEAVAGGRKPLTLYCDGKVGK